MNRRDFLGTSAMAAAGAAAAAAIGLSAAPVVAQDGSIGLATARHFKVGDATVTALSDGFLPIGAELMNGVSEADFQALLRAAYIDSATHPTGVNAYLIETDGRRVLVDAGTGAAMGPALGHLARNMTALGIDPQSIDTVVATHLHPDHIGGIAAVASNPFGAARLVVDRNDIDFWNNADIKAQAPEGVQPFFDLAQATLARFGERVEAVSGEVSLGAGLTTIPLPGHTAGHMGVMLESGGDALLIWGDIVHVPPVQFARPDVTIGFDFDADMARATRQSILDRAATDRLRVAGMHIGFPGTGYVERAAQGYHFVSAPYPYG